MQGTKHLKRAVVKAGATMLVILGMGGTASAAPKPPPLDGAPVSAKVRFSSLLGLPPEAYSLSCTGFESCTNGGNIDLATAAEVPVVRKSNVGTQGSGPLSYTSAAGEAWRTFTCGGIEPGTNTARYVQENTQGGELEVSSVAATPGQNTLTVGLNPAGISGGDFPQETVYTSNGGCGTPFHEMTQQMAQWYVHFHEAHKAAGQSIGGDLELQGLTYQKGVFAKTYERFVVLGNGVDTYRVFEATRVEVEPQFCRGKQNRIESATAGGTSLGLDGSSFYAGQVISAPPGTRIRLGDGSVIEMDKGGVYRVDRCQEDLTEIYLGETIRKFIVNVKSAAVGSEEKYRITTERAVAGVRGTVLETTYKKSKELTRVAVKEGEVTLKGINGARGKITIEAGQVGVQKGKNPPELVRR